jgi:hypothetical protein
MKKPKVTYRQEGGDDGYCYCVRVDGRAVSYADLTRRSAMSLKAKILREWEEAQR